MRRKKGRGRGKKKKGEKNFFQKKLFFLPVPKPKQLLLLRLDPFQESRDRLDRPDPRKHPQHGLVGPAVQGTIERADGAGDRREDVDAGRREVPRRRRRAVHLVLGVEREHDVERAREARVGPVRWGRSSTGVEHEQEIFGVRQALVWDGGPRGASCPTSARGAMVGQRGDGRHLGNEPHDLLVLHLPRTVDVLSRQRRVLLRMAARQRRERDEDGAHEVRVVRERRDGRGDGGREGRVAREGLGPGRELRGRRESAVDDKVGDLFLEGFFFFEKVFLVSFFFLSVVERPLACLFQRMKKEKGKKTLTSSKLVLEASCSMG